MSGDERARVIAEVLGKHMPSKVLRGCSCGVRRLARPLPDIGEFETAWAEHVASAVAAALPTPAPDGDDHPPCCTSCYGKGGTYTGPCWDCQGTGHAHPAEAPAGEDATLTEEVAAVVDDVIRFLREVYSGAGPAECAVVDAAEEAMSLAIPRLAQRGAADQATLAAVRARIEAFCADLEATDDYVRSWKCAQQLRALLDGPDAGGGRRE